LSRFWGLIALFWPNWGKFKKFVRKWGLHWGLYFGKLPPSRAARSLAQHLKQLNSHSKWGLA
jgi:hypothetical protein